MEKAKLTFSGDIMLDNETIDLYKSESNSYDFNAMFENIKNFMNESDLVVGNLETPITMDNNKIKCQQYRFTSPVEFAEAVKNAGFDLVSTANNHCLDNGIEGIQETVESLDKIGLENTGISYGEEKLKLHNINGIKIAVLSYTYGTNAFSNNIYLKNSDKNTKVNLFQNQELSNYCIRKLYLSSNLIIRIIRKTFKILGLFQLKKPVYERNELSRKQKKEIINKIKEYKKMGADCVIMCMHEGGQYNKEPIKRTKRTVDFLIKSGVDLVIGNHEHVIHPIEYKNKKLISYSLGNFISTTGVTKEPFDKMAEYSILLNIYISKNDGKIKYDKCTFTIVKSVNDYIEEKDSVKVKLLYDLIKESTSIEEKQNLMKDNQKIVKLVTGKNIDLNDLEEEYVVF